MTMVHAAENYYQTLGVEPEATGLEIKKAYFALVRKYPPERFPDDFMRIRQAYEILSNAKTRQEYDASARLPLSVRKTLEDARQALADDFTWVAVNMLEELTKEFPGISFIEDFLGEAYLENGNSGKAVEIFKKLVAKHPRNAGFSGHLAQAYLMRGWHRKAIAAFRNALELDGDNISLWNGLAGALARARQYEEAREILRVALRKGQDNDWDNAGLYFHLIQLDVIIGDSAEMEKHLEALTNLAIDREEIKESMGWALNHLARFMVQKGLTEMARAMVSRAHHLLPEAEEIGKLKEELERLEKFKEQFDRLKTDDAIHEDVVSLIELAIFPEEGFVESSLQEIDLFFAELTILDDATKYLSSFMRLEKVYPELYAVKAEFINGVKNLRKKNKMLKSYLKKAPRYEAMHQMLAGREGGAEDDEFDRDTDFLDSLLGVNNGENEDEDPFNRVETQQPYVREHPKIGRNDPCPCGSGKKYKKCCGK